MYSLQTGFQVAWQFGTVVMQSEKGLNQRICFFLYKVIITIESLLPLLSYIFSEGYVVASCISPYCRIVTSKDATSDLINSALLVLALLFHLTYTSAVVNRGSVY